MPKSKEMFPKTIYVVKEYDGESHYLIAEEDPAELAVANDDRKVAVYERVRTATIRNKTEVV